MRQLVYALVDRAEIEVLCSLPLQTYGEEVWRVVVQALESKIDRADVRPSGKLTYFHVMYAFCINHCRFTTAAAVMYDLAHQVEVAVHDARFHWDATTTKIYKEALAACLTPLRLVGPSPAHASIIRPYPPMLLPTGQNREPRPADSVMITLEDIQSKFLLADVALKLCSRDGAKRGRSGGVVLKSLANEALLAAAIEARLFDEAAMLCKRFHLDATALFNALTCEAVEEGENDRGWERVRQLLFVLDRVEDNGKNGSSLHTFKYHEAVVRCLLARKPGMELPLWLVSSFGKWGEVHHGLRRGVRAFGGGDSDTALLLRVLLEHGRVKEAAEFATEMLHGMVSEALFDRLVLATPPHLPVKLIDRILLNCGDNESRQKEQLQGALREFLLALKTQAATKQSVAMKYL